MVDLFHRIRQRLDDLDLGWRLAGGAVLAGGGAGIDGVLGAAQRGLRIPVRLARPGGPRFSDTRTTGAVGLVLAQARLTPREVLDFHLVRVERMVRGLGNRSTRHVMARADLLALELMIHLGECYQRRLHEIHAS